MPSPLLLLQRTPSYNPHLKIIMSYLPLPLKTATDVIPVTLLQAHPAAEDVGETGTDQNGERS